MCSVTYLLNTYNKFAWLQQSVPRLLRAKREGCEIVVVDGGSTDGSVAYLENLYKSGQIDKFLSEPDCGEAHGLNKGLLLSSGSLIKWLTDDDVFDYAAIERCRDYMLANPGVDLLVTPFVNAVLSGSRIILHHMVCRIGDEQAFRDRRVMNLSGLGVLIRRSSIPLLGLFRTNWVGLDHEFLLRAIETQATIAQFSDPVAVRIHNPASNSKKYRNRLTLERARLARFYPNVYSARLRGLVERLGGVKLICERIRQEVRERMRSRRERKPQSEVVDVRSDRSNAICVRDVFEDAETKLEGYRSSSGGQFMLSPPLRGLK